MKTVKDVLWTWLLPEQEFSLDREEWTRHGGKWIVFGEKKRIVRLAEGLAPFIDRGEVQSAKYWNGDPSAVNVYSLDRGRDRTRGILEGLGAPGSRVWEYDYAWDKNLGAPCSFAYSWYAKFSTILRSRGLAGSFRLLREVLSAGKKNG